MKAFIYKLSPTVAAILALSPGITLAQGSNNRTNVEEIIVTANPLGSAELHLAQPVTVLSGEQLANEMSSSIGETLSHQLGITSTAFGAGASRPVIRGQSGSRVRILQSGISSMDVSNLSPDHAIPIEPLAATQIEVLKGPSTLLFGSGASGGVVNVVTNRIATQNPEVPTLSALLEFNSVSGERAAAFTADAGLGDFAFHIDGSDRSADDYDIPGFGNLQPEPGEQAGTLRFSDLNTDNINLGGSYIGERGYLGLDIGRYRTDYGIPGEGARIVLDQDRYDIKGELNEPFSAIEKIKFQLGHVDYTHKELEPGGDVGTTFLNDEYESRLELLHAPVADWHGAFGLQIGYRDFSAIGDEALTPQVMQKSRGLFLVEERDMGDWHVELGGRVEKQDLDPKDATPSRSHTVASLSGGAIWQFMPDYSLALYASRAQRAPSLEELYNRGPHEATATFEIGNINLQRETANNVDLTLRRVGEGWDWQVNLFTNRIKDYIFGQSVDLNNDGAADRVDDDGNVTLDDDSLLLINYAQSDAHFYGIEAETTYSLGRFFQADVDGHLSFDSVRASLNNGENLPRMTPKRLGVGMDYYRGNWTGIFDLYHVFDQDKTSPLETGTDGYNLLEASVSYLISSRTGGEYVLSLRGRNLLDEEVRVHTSFLKDVAPLPGRAFIISLRATF